MTRLAVKLIVTGYGRVRFPPPQFHFNGGSMYSFTEGDRVWVKSVWPDEQEKMGHVVKVKPDGSAVVKYSQWSGIVLHQDGFSSGGTFRLIRQVTKQELDLSRRI